jgi:uncharacterized cupredoxin-like copper-binding protein
MFKPIHFVAATVVTAVTCSLAGALAEASPAANDMSFDPEQRANLSLTSFSFSPRELHLKANRPVLLRVANESSAAHDLTAPEFFTAATVRADAAANVARGKISLSAHENVIVALVPRAGRYPVRCSHPLHKMLGMSGTIVVDP